MPMQLRWRRAARREFQAAVRAIRGDRSNAAALTVVDAVYTTIGRLVCFPYIGVHLKTNGDRDIRQTSAGSYRIIYAVEGTVVEIVRVMHRRREVRIERIRDGGWDGDVTPPSSPPPPSSPLPPRPS